MSKRVKSRIVTAGDFAGETLKIKELNKREQAERNGDTHIVTIGEYDDEEYTGNITDCTEFYNAYESDGSEPTTDGGKAHLDEKEDTPCGGKVKYDVNDDDIITYSSFTDTAAGSKCAKCSWRNLCPAAEAKTLILDKKIAENILSILFDNACSVQADYEATPNSNPYLSVYKKRADNAREAYSAFKAACGLQGPQR